MLLTHGMHNRHPKGIRSDNFDINENGGPEDYLTSLSLCDVIQREKNCIVNNSLTPFIIIGHRCGSNWFWS
jgi:hypothetical protein